MKRPTFSFIIPTLNEEKFLPNLLASLVEQEGRDFEVIVVDGASKDKTVAQAKRFTKKLPLRLLQSVKASLPLQRNMGAREARGEWLVFVDADSVLLPYFIPRVSAYIQDNRPDLFTTWFRPDSEVASETMITLFALAVVEGSILIKRPLATPGPLTAVRQTLFTEIGGYDERHAFNEDVDFGLRLDAHGVKQHIIRETLYVWSMRRIRKEGAMRMTQQYVRAAVPILLFKKPLSSMSGYVMGGQMYGKKVRKAGPFAIARFRRQLKKFVKEVVT
jgi:glycosyltransferase involved in cell wall biosynthesis